jgi:anti-sigma B factor antagonist
VEPAAPFSISISEQAGTTVVVLSGELDLASAPKLTTAFAEMAHDTGDVRVDMQGVSFLDSSGISVLVHAHKRLEAQGSTLRLNGVGDAPRRVLEVAGLGDFFALGD